MKKYALLVLLILAFTSKAQAGTCTSSISSPGTFTSVDQLTADTSDTSSKLYIQCNGFQPTDTIVVCADLGSGTGGSSNSGQRLLSGPDGSPLPFQIYQDSRRTVPWGTVGAYGQGTIPLLSRTGNGSLSTVLYFRLNSSKASSVAPGTYSASFTPQIRYGAVRVAGGGCGAMPLNGITGSPFSVRATIQPSCHLDVTQNVDFGTLTHLAGNTDTSGRLSVECTKGTTYKVSLSAGNGSGATTAARKMTGPEGATITYSLYRDPRRTQIWGDNPNADSLGGFGDGTANLIPVYGRIAPQATPAPGTYADTVVVTLTY